MIWYWRESPLTVRIPALAVLTGLLLGALGGLVRSGGPGHSFEDDWTPFPTITGSDVAPAESVLASSPLWRPAPTPTSTEDAVQDETGKPGVLAYLSLVAVIKDPAPAALVRVAKTPDSLSDQLLLKADSHGLVTVTPGDEVAAGWRVSAISETTVTLAANPGQANDGEDVVHYGLFE